MKKIETNEIPFLFENGKITKTEAIKALWANIYTAPEKYALRSFSEDELSDFLLHFYPRFSSLLDAYDSVSADFTTFVRNCISFYKLSWRKRALKMSAAEQSLDSAVRLGVVEGAETADFRSDPQKSEEILKIRKKTISKKRLKSAKTPAPTLRLARDTALVLAMKSCRQIDDKTLQKLASFTGRAEEEIVSMLENVKKHSSSSEKRFEKLVAKRDSSFFRKRKYSFELSRLDPTSSEYERVKKIVENQTKNWQSQNALLSKSCVRSPRNEDIAKTLGIKMRKVYYCISHVQENGIVENFRDIFQNECSQDD